MRLSTGGGEVIAAHAADQVPLFLPEDAGTGDTLVESQFVDRRGAVLLPLAIGCSLGTVHVLHQEPTYALMQTLKGRIVRVAQSRT